MKIIRINLKNQIMLLISIFTALIIFAGIVRPEIIYAVNNNNQNIAQSFIDDMANWNQDNTGNEQCGYGTTKFNHAQHTWISEINNPRDETINIIPGQDSANMWLNYVTAHCDSILGVNSPPSASPNTEVTDRTLQETRTRVVNSSVNNGMTISGLNNAQIRLDPTQSYFFSDRYIKEAYPSTMPVHDIFTLSGLSTLAPRPTPYRILVSVRTRPVNYYNNGGQRYYTCVVNSSETNVSGFDDPDCDTVVDTFPVDIFVGADYSANCSISAPTDITIGSGFQASFTVGNTGFNNLAESSLSMSSDNNPNNLWGGLVSFPVDVDPGSTLAPGASTTWSQGTFTAPATPGAYDFRWKVIRNGSEIGSCVTPINVNPNANRPILRVNGGDVFAGAMFGGYDLPCSGTPGYFGTQMPGAPAGVRIGDIARRAHINTWGNLDYHNGGGQYAWLGASSSQYAVFSSGEAGYEFEEFNFDRAHLNHIVGNDGWIQATDPNSPPSSVQSAPVPDGTSTKDAVFANDKGKGGEYGNFYKGLAVSNWLPCVDIGAYTDTDGSKKAVTASTPTISAALADTAQVVKFTPGGGTFTLNTNLPVPDGTRKVIIVEGNLNIQSDITYDNSYTSINDIPYLQIIATGKINIFRSTTRIDAHLMAFPRNLDPSSGSGTIDTCANATGSVIGSWPAEPEIAGGGRLQYNSCDEQLVVNGTITARRVYLKRTNGTMSSDINNLNNDVSGTCRIQNGSVNSFNSLVTRENICAAELINFYPEGYIATLQDNSATGVQSVPVDSIELPPIY